METLNMMSKYHIVYQKMENQTRGLVASLPTKENTLRGYARNFKIVEELYVFLLQRKEEASISYISALPNLKVLSYGVSGELPIAPKGKIIYLGALVLGLLIPFGVLYLIKLLDTKINTRDDLEQGLKGISILGEVPFDENLKKGVKTKSRLQDYIDQGGNAGSAGYEDEQYDSGDGSLVRRNKSIKLNKKIFL